MRKLRLFLCAMLFLMSIGSLLAQAPRTRTENYWTIGAQANIFYYFGDLNPLNQRITVNPEFLRPNLGIQVGRKISNRVSLRLGLAYGRLRGDDRESAKIDENNLQRTGRFGRNLSFRNDVIELSFTGTWDLLAKRGRFYRRAYFTPYLMGGVAVYHHNPEGKAPDAFGGGWVNLRELHTEGQGLPGYAKQYSKWQIAFPLGVGLKFRMTDRIDIAAELGFRILTTDHIDDVGGRYPNLQEIYTNFGPLAAAMSNRSGEGFDNLPADQQRALASIVGGVTNNFYTGINPANGLPTGMYQLPNGQRTLSSYNISGDIRGNGPFFDIDIYTTLGLHVNYILTTRRHPRYRAR